MQNLLKAQEDWICVLEKMSPQLTSAMWAESGVHEKSKQRIITSHVRSNLGQSLFSSEKMSSKLREENILADRTYGDTIHEKVVTVEDKGLGDIFTKTTHTKVEYFVECPFENTMLEIRKRFQSDMDISGYTLGYDGVKYIVVCDGGDYGNVAFRQVITVLSSDNGTCGRNIITARIEAHEEYDLFNTTIQPVLSKGISMLQESAIVFIKLDTGGTQMVPIPYISARNACHPTQPGSPLFEKQDTHSDFVVTEGDFRGEWFIIEGSLRMRTAEDKGPGYFDGFIWLYKGENNIVFEDSIDFDKAVLASEIASMVCLPIVVCGIGDIPYQAFQLGKLNMGSVHCNYCNCPNSMFGKEERCEIINFTQDQLVKEGRSYQEYTAERNRKRALKESVHQYDGMKGITCVPYSRIPVVLWVLPILHIFGGQLGDTKNRFQRFILERIFDYSNNEFLVLENLAITRKKLQIFQDEINRKELSRQYFFDLSKTTVYKDGKGLF